MDAGRRINVSELGFAIRTRKLTMLFIKVPEGKVMSEKSRGDKRNRGGNLDRARCHDTEVGRELRRVITKIS
jgi:hypothetical protein